jgi:hypothetical protein
VRMTFFSCPRLDEDEHHWQETVHIDGEHYWFGQAGNRAAVVWVS